MPRPGQGDLHELELAVDHEVAVVPVSERARPRRGRATPSRSPSSSTTGRSSTPVRALAHGALSTGGALRSVSACVVATTRSPGTRRAESGEGCRRRRRARRRRRRARARARWWSARSASWPRGSSAVARGACGLGTRTTATSGRLAAATASSALRAAVRPERGGPATRAWSPSPSSNPTARRLLAPTPIGSAHRPSATAWVADGGEVEALGHDADRLLEPAAPTSCAPSTPSGSAPGRRRLQLAAAATATARCSRRSPLCERIAGRELDWTLSDEARIGDHRWWISDLGPFRARLPGAGGSTYDIEDDPARDPRRRTPSAGAAAAHEALGRHPGPQRGRGRSPAPCARSRAALDARRIDHEIIVVDDASTRRDGRRRRGASPPRNPRVRCIALALSRSGFGFAVRAGLDAFKGDAVAIMMADGSDDPADLRPLPPAARGGLRLRLRLALHARREVTDYPRLKLVDQPARQLRSSGSSSGTATTTRPTPSRPTGAR